MGLHTDKLKFLKELLINILWNYAPNHTHTHVLTIERRLKFFPDGCRSGGSSAR